MLTHLLVRVLILEAAAGPLKHLLNQAGVDADPVTDVEFAAVLACDAYFDVVLVDGATRRGIEADRCCSRLRAAGVTQPILLVAASAGLPDVAALPWPFSYADLISRLVDLAGAGPRTLSHRA